MARRQDDEDVCDEADFPQGYSYLRYSSAAQSEGDSTRRQDGLAESWCKRNRVRLDASTRFCDRGKSAFRGKHRRTGVLAQFLADVGDGLIKPGSFLIIENLDRLSRENPWDAVPLLCSIVNAGISVVTLSPAEMIYRRGRDMTPLVLAVVEFGRGHSESATKSDRLSALWQEKQRLARENGSIVTRRLPAWVAEKGGKLVPIPERAKLVRRIFSLACRGYGLFLIVKTLTNEGVAVWGRGKRWTKAYIHKILTGKVVLGEYQPIRGGKPDGNPIAGYYPVIIREEVWQQAQAALARRRVHQGRMGPMVPHLFGGLLTDARTGERLRIALQTRGSGKNAQKVRCIVSSGSLEGCDRCVSFPYVHFEKAILSQLREIDPADVIGESESQTVTLKDEVATLESSVADIEAELNEGGDSRALARVLRGLEEKLETARQRLEAAEREESGRTGAAWGDTKSLIDVARDEPARLRLRDLLRVIVSEVRVLVVAANSCRAAGVEIRFRGSKGVRFYAMLYKPARRGRTGSLEIISVQRPASVEQFELLLKGLCDKAY